MKTFKSILKYQLLFLLISFSYGQKIVHMNGTYDLDGDNMLEFLSLEINPDLEVFPTAVRYYEIDSDGYQNLIWEFMPPVALEGDFVNAQIGDVDGDGSPELVLVMNLTRFEDSSTPHVFIATYTWDGTHFSEIPSASLDIGKENIVVRFNEKPKENEAWINGGFFMCDPKVLDYINNDSTIFEKEPLSTISREGKLYTFKHKGFWKCMDTLRDKRELEKLASSGNPPWILY